ncbi:MAG: hypothetical protein CM1200mP32_11900 [Methanobacteriota archaeon]|nr:MAG: hypothetical protein CM1200mP32_11900 [Euryarchaeota archaeon]
MKAATAAAKTVVLLERGHGHRRDRVCVEGSSRGLGPLAAVSPDDPSSFEAEIVEVDGAAELRIRVVGDRLKTVRSTVDDLLACLAAAESSLDVTD